MRCLIHLVSSDLVSDESSTYSAHNFSQICGFKIFFSVFKFVQHFNVVLCVCVV